MQNPNISHMPFATLNDTRLAENRLGQGLAEARRYGNYHAAVQHLPGSAIFKARPFCEQ